MGTRAKLFATLALAGACGALAVPSIAGAARTGVTVHQHRDFLYGFVFSPKPDRCAEGRKVLLLKRRSKGQQRDRRIESSTAHEVTSGPHKGKFRWGDIRIRSSFGSGKFYVLAPKLKKCDRDTSKAIFVSARPETEITQAKIQHLEGRAIFKYHSVGGIKPYQHFCRLDKGPVEGCGNTRQHYGDVSSGRHVFRVWGESANGLTERKPAKRTFHM